jgi:hypothetical protein
MKLQKKFEKPQIDGHSQSMHIDMWASDYSFLVYLSPLGVDTKSKEVGR